VSRRLRSKTHELTTVAGTGKQFIRKLCNYLQIMHAILFGTVVKQKTLLAAAILVVASLCRPSNNNNSNRKRKFVYVVLIVLIQGNIISPFILFTVI
jgi:hypothetical protein